MYLKGAPIIVTIPMPIRQPAIIKNIILFGYIAMAISPAVIINVPIIMSFREPVESRNLPRIGAATALAPKIGISIRLASWSLNPIERITRDGMNITDEYIMP